MQIRGITSEGRVVSRVRAVHPNAAPHAWEATEGVRLSALADSRPAGRNGDTAEVWLDARALAAIDAFRQERTADEAAILEDAARHRGAWAAVTAANHAHGEAPTPATSAAPTAAFNERGAAEAALKPTARAGVAGRIATT